MKKVNGLFAVVFVLLTLFTACTNDKSSVDYAQIDAEKAKVSSLLVLTKAYNDTLKMVYDTVKVHKNNSYCLKYDKLYHTNDSLFTMHYNMFGDIMYADGIMMNNYAHSTGMMQGGMGMMDANIDMTRMMGDTATVGSYYRNMHTIHTQHSVYHNAIYN
jgi:hypothetical protein